MGSNKQKMPKTGANSNLAAMTTRNMATRVNSLETNIQQGLQELKNQVLGKEQEPSDKEALIKLIQDFEKKALKEIQEFKNSYEKIEREIENIKQDNMANCIVINGMGEKNDQDLYSEVTQLIKNKININTSKQDIDICYRLGKKVEDKTRPVVVKFVNRWVRECVFENKKKLKGSGFVISECLTNKKLVLLKKVRESVGLKSCWTWNGKVYALINNNKKLIRSEQDLIIGENND